MELKPPNIVHRLPRTQVLIVPFMELKLKWCRLWYTARAVLIVPFMELKRKNSCNNDVICMS